MSANHDLPGGFERYQDADAIGVVVDGEGEPGDVVTRTNSPHTVTLAGDGDEIWGILREPSPADDTDKKLVILEGAVPVKTVEGTGPDAKLVGSATAGVARGINTEGATGETQAGRFIETLGARGDLAAGMNLTLVK